MKRDYSYSIALYEIYKESKNKKKFYEDLQSLYFSIRKNKDLIKILSSRMLSKNERKKIINNIFGIKIELFLKNFLFILIDDEFFKNVLHILKMTLKEVDIDKDQIFVKIESAYNLDQKNITKILNSIKKKWNKKIDYTLIINKDLIGGLKIIINDNEIDGSIKGKIDQLKNEIDSKK